jgi:uncharacterized protein YyaL (SSP411 family)
MHNSLLVAVEEYLYPTQTIVLRGNTEALSVWQARCIQYYAPRRLVIAIPEHAKELPGVLAQRTMKNGVTAYLCAGHACEAPVTELGQLDVLLAATEFDR